MLSLPLWDCFRKINSIFSLLPSVYSRPFSSSTSLPPILTRSVSIVLVACDEFGFRKTDSLFWLGGVSAYSLICLCNGCYLYQFVGTHGQKQGSWEPRDMQHCHNRKGEWQVRWRRWWINGEKHEGETSDGRQTEAYYAAASRKLWWTRWFLLAAQLGLSPGLNMVRSGREILRTLVSDSINEPRIEQISPWMCDRS